MQLTYSFIELHIFCHDLLNQFKGHYFIKSSTSHYYPGFAKKTKALQCRELLQCCHGDHYLLGSGRLFIVCHWNEYLQFLNTGYS